MYLFAGYANRKRRGPYFIFHVKGQLRLFESGAFFNYRQNTCGEYRENSELSKKKDKYVHLEPLYEPGRFQELSLVVVLFLKLYGFDISF